MARKSGAKAVKRRMAASAKEQEPDAAKDWTTGGEIDVSKMETGVFKFPALFENRSQERMSQRELGHVAFSIRIPGRDAWVAVRLWDFTSISFGIHVEAESAIPGVEGPAGSLSLQIGDDIQIRIRVQARQEFKVWCRVMNMNPWKDGTKMGLRRLDVAIPQSVEYDRRESFRLPLSPALSLQARIKHPYIYGHWCALNVSDVNREMGLSLHCRDHSILVFEGMELELRFDLAALSNAPMTVRVMWINATESNSVQFGVACLAMDWILHNSICNFLLHSRQWTPLRLRETGFLAQQVKGQLRFRSVKTMGEYAEVLHLRRQAYVHAGKRHESTTPEDMASPLDGMSRILIAHHRGTLVGTLTFAFPTLENTILDSQAGFPGQKYPVGIPPKANLIEVSRLCIHEEYRGTDLLQGLFEQGLKHFMLSDRHWLLTSAVDELMPMYERIGFQRLKASYKHPRLNNQVHHLIIAHRNAFLRGEGMNLFVWNAFFGGLVSYLLDRRLIPINPSTKAIIRLKLLFRSLSRIAIESRARAGFRRHLQALRQYSRSDSRPMSETGIPVPGYDPTGD